MALAGDRPAKQLLGKTLDGGWHVTEMLQALPCATGGHFSQSYIVRSDTGETAFLKALDYVEALTSIDPPPSLALLALTEAYSFERRLVEKCGRGMDRVVRGLASGTIRMDSGPSGVVEYLIFERADGDVRAHLASVAQIELTWILKCLHHVATGLMQLHSVGIAHQDLKPSNVLVFERTISKIGDLGRAAYLGTAGPYDENDCAGDLTYAPPEVLYGFRAPEWRERRFGCDLYLLGSLVVFFFSGLGMTGLLMNELAEPHRWRNWDGSFAEVLPYLRDAFSKVLVKLEQSHIPKTRIGASIKVLITELCDPDPAQRGDPKNLELRFKSPLSLERYVSRLDLLAKRAEVELRNS